MRPLVTPPFGAANWRTTAMEECARAGQRTLNVRVTVFALIFRCASAAGIASAKAALASNTPMRSFVGP
jgi:hypothetical protein